MDAPIRKLILREPGQPELDFPLSEGVVTLGRSRSANIRLADPEISRIHCSIEVEGDRVWLSDCNSQLGTLLNGKPISAKVSLADGDRISIGSIEIACAFPAPAPECEPENAGGETRMAPQGFAESAPAEPEEQRGTGGMMFEGTRMLDPAELRGMKTVAAAAPSRFRVPLGLAVILLVFGGLALLFRESPETITRQTQRYFDAEYAIRIDLPANWAEIKEPDALAAFEGPSAHGFPRLIIYADRALANSLTPLHIGFNGYISALRGTPREMETNVAGRIVVNDAEVYICGYSRPAYSRRGKVLFLLNGEDRVAVEIDCAIDSYGIIEAQFQSVLETFFLDREQKTFDFSPPDDVLRRRALASPEGLLADAQHEYDKGLDYLANKDVKPDNIYRAVQKFRDAARMCYALSTRPELYKKSVAELLRAQRLFNKTVRDQNFLITSAWKQNDYDAVYWESLKLMQMVPEKSHPAYQDAQNWMKAIPPSARR